MKPFIAVAVLSLSMWTMGCSQQATEKMGDALDSAEQSASETMSEAKEAASDAADSVQESAGTTVEAAKVVTEEAAGKVEDAKDSIEKGMAGLVEKASAALSSVEGGPALLKNVTGFFESAQESLSGITNTETAQAAMAKLGDLDGSIEGLSKSMSALPEEARTALAGVIEKGTESIKALIEKANAIPGVKEIVQPKVDELMQKLSALTGKS